MKRELYSHYVSSQPADINIPALLRWKAHLSIPFSKKEHENYVCSINRLEFQGYNA